MAENENINTNTAPDLNLEAIIAAAIAQSNGSTPGQGQPGTAAKTEAGSRQHRSKAASSCRERIKMSWEEIKRRVRERLASLDQEKLKSLLLAAGLCVGAVAAVLLVLKLMPLGLTLAALVGLGLSLHLLERMRWLTVFF